eukprot:8443071-Pyramimonas_sp.AAC.1
MLSWPLSLPSLRLPRVDGPLVIRDPCSVPGAHAPGKGADRPPSPEPKQRSRKKGSGFWARLCKQLEAPKWLNGSPRASRIAITSLMGAQFS